MKYSSGEKNNQKPKSSLENQIRKFKKITNSLRGSLSCLGFIEDLSKCNKSWYANVDSKNPLPIKKTNISFKNVFFKYFKESIDYAIMYMSFDIKEGETIGNIKVY